MPEDKIVVRELSLQDTKYAMPGFVIMGDP